MYAKIIYYLCYNQRMIISEIIEKINSSKDSNAVIDYLIELHNSNQELRFIDKTGAYVYKNYYILPSFTNKNDEFLTTLKNNLKLVNQICKTSSPEIVDIISTQDEKFTVIIYKINESENAELIPYLQTNGASIEKKEIFKSEQTKLIEEKNLYNPEILIGIENYYLTPDTQNIVFGSWTGLISCEDETKKSEFLNSLNRLL